MPSRTLLWPACLLALIIASQSAAAAIIYVNNINGDDRNNGLHAINGAPGDGPLATVGRALKIARGTDLISIANTGEPYSESVTLDRPDLAGTPRFPLIIECNGATIRGARRLPSDVWRRVGQETYRYQPYRKGHYQFLINGSVAERTEARGEPDLLTLQPLHWSTWRGFLYFRVEPMKYPEQYQIEAPLFEVGLGLHNARHTIVRNLNVEHYRLDGVAVTGNSRNVRLINIRSTGNGRAGLSVSGTSQVYVSGLDLSGNREADQLELLKGQIHWVADDEPPAAPAPPVPTSPQLEPQP